MIIGGAEGDRTPDLMNAIHARSQLRHSPRSLVYRLINLAKKAGCCQPFFLDSAVPAHYNFFDFHSLTFLCRRGGTGRRAGLKIPCPLRTCRFNSDRRHHTLGLRLSPHFFLGGSLLRKCLDSSVLVIESK